MRIMALSDDLTRIVDAALATQALESLPVAVIAFLWQTDSTDTTSLEARIYQKIDELMQATKSGQLPCNTDAYQEDQKNDDVNGLSDSLRVRIDLWDLARWARTRGQFPKFLLGKIVTVVISDALDRPAETLGGDLDVKPGDIPFKDLAEAYEATKGRLQIPISVAALSWMAEFPKHSGKAFVDKFYKIQDVLMTAIRTAALPYATPRYLPSHSNDFQAEYGVGFDIGENCEIGAYDLIELPDRVLVRRRDLAKWAILNNKKPMFLRAELDALIAEDRERTEIFERLEMDVTSSDEVRFRQVLANLARLDDSGGIPLAFATKLWALRNEPDADILAPVKLNKAWIDAVATSTELIEMMRQGKVLYSTKPWEVEIEEGSGTTANGVLDDDVHELTDPPRTFIQDPWVIRVRVIDLALFESSLGVTPAVFPRFLKSFLDSRLKVADVRQSDEDESTHVKGTGHPGHNETGHLPEDASRNIGDLPVLLKVMIEAYDTQWKDWNPNNPKINLKKNASVANQIEEIAKRFGQELKRSRAEDMASLIRPLEAPNK